MLIERADNTINLCEIKFSINEYTLSADYEKILRNKIAWLQEETKHRKTILLTLITTYGVAANAHAHIVSRFLTMDDLFD